MGDGEGGGVKTGRQGEREREKMACYWSQGLICPGLLMPHDVILTNRDETEERPFLQH